MHFRWKTPQLISLFLSILLCCGGSLARGTAAFGQSRRSAAPLPPVAKAGTVDARTRAEHLLRRLRILGSRTPLVRIRIAKNTRATAARAVRVTRGAPLTFKFENFTSAQTTEFQTYLQKAYPLMVQLYGEPAPSQQGAAVRVVFDSTAGDGLYELPPAEPTNEGGIIQYNPVTTADGLTAEQARNINNFNLTRQILIAFHGINIFDFDAWELGFSDAAALVVMYQALGSPANFDPSALGVYLLPVYDFFNRPELGNAFFFAEGASLNLGFYRAGMAQAAWLKAYVENPNFFKGFNQQYYNQLATNPGVPLSGNVPALKQIAAGIVPTVEGLRFTDWYRRQYVLDTSVTVGDKLWVAVLPLAASASGDTRSVLYGVAQRYRTLADGSEQPLSGTGSVVALDENGADITSTSVELNQDNRVIFNSLGEAELDSQNTPQGFLPVVGFRNTGTPDRGRITLLFNVGAAQAVAFFPYNVAGTTTQPTGFYGATLGTNEGTVRLQVIGGAAGAATLNRGAFKTTVPYPSGPRVRSEFRVFPTDGAAPRTILRNSAWSVFDGGTQSLAVLLETAPGNATFTSNLTSTGGNLLRMISLPLFPTESDEAAVLGLDPNTLLLARYRPNLSPVGFGSGGIQYGISADKHELYPNINEPFAPGRGYWLKLRSNLALSVQGGEPPKSQPYEVPLLGGWNQIGVPFNQSFLLGNVQVRLREGGLLTYATALSRNLILPGVWRWKIEGGYERVDTGSAASQVLQPFEGYYIFTPEARGVKLVFTPTTTTATATTRNVGDGVEAGLTTKAVAGEWKLPLAVTAGGRQSNAHAFGVTTLLPSGKPHRMPAANPPASERALTLSFLHSGTAVAEKTKAGGAGGWAESYVLPFTTATTWQFLVDGVAPGTVVRLTWGNPRNVPNGISLMLVDETTSQRVPMLAVNPAVGYTFVAGSGPRHFRVEARTGVSPITGLTVTPWPQSSFALVSAEFSESGIAKVEVLDAQGAVRRVLVERAAIGGGRYFWAWDLRDSSGRSMPRGTYTARVTFVDWRGATYQAIRSFSF